MAQYFEIVDKKILVTGASSGIGKAVAIHLALEGASLLINGRDEQRLKETFASLHGAGHDFVVGDLTDETCIENIAEKSSKIEGLVHCAGLVQLLPFRYQTEESIRTMMEVNYFAPTQLIHKLVKNKKLSKPASIVIISSITSASSGTVGGSIYGSSKGAIEGLVRSLAIELGRSKVRINTIAPGMVETEAIDSLRLQVSDDALKMDMRKYPLGRYGNPIDVALACQYLLSDASNWVTGIRLVVDGGLSAQS
ncbi:MAG: 3-oxoacyl-ACP reductase [Bacteroidetes bacterium]|nr:MAG: 3-oxoacyl-ACP reductase [Bacteroidota bacterium]